MGLGVANQRSGLDQRAYLPLFWAGTFLNLFCGPIPCRCQTDASAALRGAAVPEAVLEKLPVAKFSLQDLAPVKTAGDLEVTLLLAGQPRHILLQRHSLRAAGFRVLAQEANGFFRSVQVPESQTYRGYVAGCGGSSVSASITEAGIRAQVYLGDGGTTTWAIEPLPIGPSQTSAGRHLVYSSEDLGGENGTCGNRDAPAAGRHPALPLGSGPKALEVRVCRIACDADYEYYALNGSSLSNTVADIEAVINGVSAVFERDTAVAFQLTQILVREAEPDPYTATTVDGLLSQFRLDWRNNHSDIPRDIAHLFTGKSFGTVLGNSYTDQVCPAFDHYSLVRSRWQTDLGKRIALSAHEIGHSFDAVHCDYDGDPRCRIMCANLGGCSNGYHSFEDLNIARIRATAASAACLTTGAGTTPTTTLPFTDNFNSITYPPRAPDPARWTAADLAECQYQHLGISIGQDYNSNQKLGTVRTLPMQLSGAARVQYKVNCNLIPSSQSLKIDYFNSTTFTWLNLRSIIGDGSSQYRLYEDTVPASGAGNCFAVRFSAYATTRTASYTWYVDDVSISPVVVAPRLSIAATETNTVIISWPQPAPEWKLETADVPATDTAGWTLIAPPYPTNTTQHVVTEPVVPTSKFYRLRTP
jgi:hypothetical protein